MDIRLIALDLDGTLLSTERKISERNLQTLKKCRMQGIKICFSTARNEDSSKEYINLVNPDGVISNIGARARLGTEVIYERFLENSHCQEIIKLVYEKNYNFGIQSPDKYRSFMKSLEAAKAYSWYYQNGENFDFSKPFLYPAYKATIEFEDRQLLEEMKKAYSQYNFTEYYGENWVSISHKEAAKTNALNALAKNLGLEISQVAAFGDDYSDMDMLKLAGCGIAMENAHEEVKKNADFVTLSNDCDGVSYWIEKHILDS